MTRRGNPHPKQDFNQAVAKVAANAAEQAKAKSERLLKQLHEEHQADDFAAASAARAAAKEREKAAIRREEAEAARARYAEQVELWKQRSGNTVQAPDETVWGMLTSPTSKVEYVADNLQVTPATLLRWMDDPARKDRRAQFEIDCAYMDLIDGRHAARDEARDPKCRAVQLQGVKVTAETLGRAHFKQPDTEINAGPIIITGGLPD